MTDRDPELALAESMTFTITGDEIAELRRKLDGASRGKVKLLTPLPRRTRLRLWAHARIDHLGCWLISHDHLDAAERLWRACRMWTP